MTDCAFCGWSYKRASTVVSNAAVAEWVRAWDTAFTMFEATVVSSIPDRGNIVGCVFIPPGDWYGFP